MAKPRCGVNSGCGEPTGTAERARDDTGVTTMRWGTGVTFAAAAALAGGSAPAQPPREDGKPEAAPYFASIAPGRARMRSGPGRAYPSTWLYQRADLPVKVLARFKEWRKVEDPAGTQGWMLGSLISNRRTAIVTGDEPAQLREKPSPGARIAWRAEPGVVGRISACSTGWCRIDVHGQAGFVETGRLWGVETMEALP